MFASSIFSTRIAQCRRQRSSDFHSKSKKWAWLNPNRISFGRSARYFEKFSEYQMRFVPGLRMKHGKLLQVPWPTSKRMAWFKEAPFLDGNTGIISFLVPTRMTFMPLVLSNSLLELIGVCMPVSTCELLYPDVSFAPSPSNLVSDMNLQNDSFGFFLYLERETQLYISCIYRVRYLTVRWTTTGHTKGWRGGTGSEGYGDGPRGMGRWHSESCRIQMC